MTDKNLSKLLEQLHDELGKVDAVDDKGRELLRSLDDDIRKLLERSEGAQTDESMLERLQDAIDHFEITHPNLTSALSHMMTILSNAGI
ncbi:MAG: DUF4404 family protein [Chloroflexi bacterium]|nr:DUF4404 family protein [Chloroflexota bacterium]